MNTQDTANYILIDLYAESQLDLLGDARTAPAGISSFHGNDRVDDVLVRSFRARSIAMPG
jgi:hypothetical protein